MLFADDSYLHCRADEEESLRMLNSLQVFENAFRQKETKSSVFFSSNIIHSNRTQIGQILNMIKADEKITYLGLLNMLREK